MKLDTEYESVPVTGLAIDVFALLPKSQGVCYFEEFGGWWQISLARRIATRTNEKINAVQHDAL